MSLGRNPIGALAGAVWHGVTHPGDVAREGVGLITHPDRLLSAAVQVSVEAVTVVRSVVAPETTRPAESDRWSVTPERPVPAEETAPADPPAPFPHDAETVYAPAAEPAPAEETPLPGEPDPHVDAEAELVAEFADPGAEEGAGPELRVEPPWEDYAGQSAEEITQRLAQATDAELAVVELYERQHRGRPTVLQEAERELARRA
jgi:hypothetical protein